MEPLKYKNTDADNIKRIVGNISNVVADEDLDDIHVACLTLALGTMANKLTFVQLVEGVKGASEWMALYLSSTGLNKEQVN